ncbi:MAG TPA: hypothetical protein DCS13_10015 [Candidatus Margulisbacteria bacterium]|nr:MAG: hypothetical protein A2X43_11690 [Candidatus Margulisbacteria bacterium GWD2_39_127]OGI01802.1 MAG: hypothetical protein A2X42_04215 [Candidatus Margulisbacteria bacterium GWF2_38_17]HAR63788.1 hypothetical protein [Candidatus Margulisiibacteriota bacterium]HCY37786.1 hypothetical protein [Candidatus Margulisiibacteriota bacterium]
MDRIFNKAGEKDKRRSLRNNMTKAEAIMWNTLRNDSQLGYRFVRQYSVEAFVIDFYCRKLRLAVEIDGSVHDVDGARDYDQAREQIVKQYGITFLRFKNSGIEESPLRCKGIIKKKLAALEKEKIMKQDATQ